MSTLSVTTIKTESGTTPLTITTGNNTSGIIKVESANTDILVTGNTRFTGSEVVISSNVRPTGTNLVISGNTQITGRVTITSQPALRLDGNNGAGINFAADAAILTSTYYSSNLSRGDLSWNGTTGRITASTAGYYAIMSQFYVQTSTGNGNGRLGLRKNGTLHQLMQTGLSSEGTYDINTIIYLAANDYVDVVCDGFDTIRMYMGPYHSSFHIFLLG